MDAHPTPAAATDRSGPRSRPGFRPEIEGLRAVACLLVVGYHVWTDRISGGVDVFFLLTGFLLSGQLVRAAGRGGVDVRRTWRRVLRRLSPAALTVLAVTSVATLLLLPPERWAATFRHVLASGLYLENWQLAHDAADYLARSADTSVVQHFWSLSIQGQVYLVWPLLVALVVLLVPRRPALATGLVLSGLATASLAYSVWLTAADQPLAYVSSLTRVWEFALGGLLALVVDRVHLPRAARLLCGWLGLVGLVVCGLVLSVGTVFPGYAALWPVLSGALVVVAGTSGSRVGADRVLAWPPLAYAGGLSYALYLWHWPVLALTLAASGRTRVDVDGGVAVVLVSVALAVATHHLVERPLLAPRRGRHAASPSRPTRAWRPWAVAASVVVLLAATSTVATQRLSTPGPPATAGGAGLDNPGARALVEGFRPEGRPDAPLTPSFVDVARDWAAVESCAESPRGAELQVCLDPPAGDPVRRIVVVGDSHPLQLVAGLKPVAAERGWQVIVMWRGMCPFSVDSEVEPDNQACKDWNTAAVEEILDLHPDAVLTMATRDVRPGVDERTPPGYVAQWERLAAKDIPVVAVRDNPRFDAPPSVCVEARGADSPECATPRADLYAAEPPWAALERVPPNVRFVDLSDYYCGPDVCPPVIGNVLVYMDDNHLTATYAATMAPVLGAAIEAALGWDTTPTAPGAATTSA